MTARDVDLVQHRIDTLTRAATRIRRHLHDLHALAFEQRIVERENVASSKPESKPPASGDPRARAVWARVATEVARCEDILIGLERQVVGHFMVNSESPKPSRGSRISADEHARLLANQRARAAAGEYVPALLADQPPHPGRAK